MKLMLLSLIHILFRKNYLKFTEKCYKSAEMMDELNNQFDTFVAGSDQIWNCLLYTSRCV